MAGCWCFRWSWKVWEATYRCSQTAKTSSTYLTPSLGRSLAVSKVYASNASVYKLAMIYCIGTPWRHRYGAPLFPIIANLYVETFETQALEMVNLRPKLRLWYMDVVFAVLEHGEQLLKTLHDYLNNQHLAIWLIVERGWTEGFPFECTKLREIIPQFVLQCFERKFTPTITSTSITTTIQGSWLE